MPDISTRRIQKSPRWAGVFGRIGASTEVLETPSAGGFINDCYVGATSMPAYCGTPSRVRATPAVRPSYPDTSAVRAFTRFIGERQHANGGQPVILHPSEIARATGITEADQIGIRQTLMLAGRLRLSVIGHAWAYHLEPRA